MGLVTRMFFGIFLRLKTFYELNAMHKIIQIKIHETFCEINKKVVPKILEF
jgi:hypothetical protein